MTTSTATVLPHSVQAPPEMQMLEMLYGSLGNQLLSVAAEFGLADLVADGPRTVDDLAAHTGTHAGVLYRVLRALAGLGVFTEISPRTFAITPLAATLRTGVPGTLRDLAQDVGGRARHAAYAELAHTVRTGTPAFDQAHGKSLFAYLTANPAESEVFSRAMGNLASHAHAAAVAAYDLSNVRRLVDVAGGEGYLIATILPRYPGMTATLFDEPHVVAGAGRVFAQAGISDRVEAVGGDLFESVPAGGDAYVLSSILFSYDDAQSQTILTNIRNAMNPDGKLLILEPIVPEGDEPHPGKMLDIVQLALATGEVRTEAQFARLFEAAGLRLDETRIMWPSAPTDLITAVAA